MNRHPEPPEGFELLCNRLHKSLKVTKKDLVWQPVSCQWVAPPVRRHQGLGVVDNYWYVARRK